MKLIYKNKTSNDVFDAFYRNNIHQFIKLFSIGLNEEKTLCGYFFIDSICFDGNDVEIITDGFYHKFDYDSGTSKFWFRSNRLIFDKCIIDGNSNYKIEIITKDEYFSELNKTLEITKNNFTH